MLKTEEKHEGGASHHRAENSERHHVDLHGKKLYLVKVLHSRETITGAGDEAVVLADRDPVIIMTRHGKDMGQILRAREHQELPDEEDVFEIFRKATGQDLERYEANHEREKQAFRTCQKKIEEHQLEMKLVSTHFLLDESKILFFFTADNRIDFRELVKDLVTIFKTRIELRQIGVRDEARVVGGMGICGRAFCCHAVTDRLNPVSIKMAKEQNISLNSLKISGPCGRLLCCLGYEHEFYHCEKMHLPSEGMQIVINKEQFVITEINVLVRRVRLSGGSGRILHLSLDLFQRDGNGTWTIDKDRVAELNLHS